MENEKDTTLTATTSGSKYFSNVRSPATSHTQTLSNPFRNLTNKVRGKIFYKEVFLRLLSCVRRFIPATLSLCVCLIIYCVVMMLHEHVYVYISIFIMWVYNTTVITEANTIVGLYLYSVFTNPMFLSTNSLSIVHTFSWEYISISSHIVGCPLSNITSVH